MVRFILLCLLFALPLCASDGVCQKCVRIREENALKAKDQKWVFYEEWLEKEGSAVSSQDEEHAEADKSRKETPH